MMENLNSNEISRFLMKKEDLESLHMEYISSYRDLKEIHKKAATVYDEFREIRAKIMQYGEIFKKSRNVKPLSGSSGDSNSVENSSVSHHSSTSGNVDQFQIDTTNDKNVNLPGSMERQFHQSLNIISNKKTNHQGLSENRKSKVASLEAQLINLKMMIAHTQFEKDAMECEIKVINRQMLSMRSSRQKAKTISKFPQMNQHKDPDIKSKETDFNLEKRQFFASKGSFKEEKETTDEDTDHDTPNLSASSSGSLIPQDGNMSSSNCISMIANDPQSGTFVVRSTEVAFEPMSQDNAVQIHRFKLLYSDYVLEKQKKTRDLLVHKFDRGILGGIEEISEKEARALHSMFSELHIKRKQRKVPAERVSSAGEGDNESDGNSTEIGECAEFIGIRECIDEIYAVLKEKCREASDESVEELLESAFSPALRPSENTGISLKSICKDNETLEAPTFSLSHMESGLHMHAPNYANSANPNESERVKSSPLIGGRTHGYSFDLVAKIRESIQKDWMSLGRTNFESSSDGGEGATKTEQGMMEFYEKEEGSTSTENKNDRKCSHANPLKVLSPHRTPIRMSKKSLILDQLQIEWLASQLPARYHSYDMIRLYSTEDDGFSLQAFFRKAHGASPTVLIIRDSNDNVFGGFAITPWNQDHKYYGTGESFVFSIQPEMHSYKWSRKNSYFQLSSSESIAMGGGSHFAFWLDAEFLNGSTGHCDTFESPCLSSSEEFQCVNFEAWSFVAHLRI